MALYTVPNLYSEFRAALGHGPDDFRNYINRSCTAERGFRCVDRADEQTGDTFMHYAVVLDDPVYVRCLCDHDPPIVANAAGMTPIHVLCNLPPPFSLAKLRPILRLLVDPQQAYDIVTARDIYEQTAADRAMVHRHRAYIDAITTIVVDSADHMEQQGTTGNRMSGADAHAWGRELRRRVRRLARTDDDETGEATSRLETMQLGVCQRCSCDL